MAKYLYCSLCGCFVSLKDKTCPNCNKNLVIKESVYNTTYYENKSKSKYGSKSLAHTIFMNEEFVPTYNNITSAKSVEQQNKEEFIPRCPTCQSKKIIKLSNIKRAAHGYAFGLFSKTARSQFECKNCGYKW